MSSHADSAPATPLRLNVPRFDQSPARSLFSDDRDFSELLSIVSSSPSSSSEILPADLIDDLPDTRNIDGSTRLFSAQNTLYMLPLDELEYKRLDKQHTIQRVGLLGLYPERQLVSSILGTSGPLQNAVLDIGCGTGKWAQEVASEFPHARIVAIDQVPQIDFDMAPNLEFQRHDVNDGLEPFYGQFDVVHARCIASGIMRYRELVDEARRCLRPGGIAIFIEGDFDLFTEDQQNLQEPASDSNPDGSWLQQWMHAVRMAQVKRAKVDSSDNCPETLDQGLWQFKVFDPNSCGAASLFVPTTPWINSTLEEEALHYKIAGVLMRQNLKLFILSTEQMLLEDGIAPEQVDEWMVKIRDEIENEGTFKTWYHYRIAWGRAPGSTATPLPAPGPLKPQTIITSRARELRRRLINMVEHFKIKQYHVFNEKQALAFVNRRTGLPFNTRGRF